MIHKSLTASIRIAPDLALAAHREERIQGRSRAYILADWCRKGARADGVELADEQTPENIAAISELVDRVTERPALAVELDIPERAVKILTYRLMGLPGRVASLAETGEKFDLSRQRVAQIQAAALDKFAGWKRG